MSTRTCSGCSNSLPKADFSKNQWQKGPTAKCKGCVSGNPSGNPVPEPPSPELREQPEESVVKKEEEEQAAATATAAAAAAAEKGRLAMQF